LFLKSGREELRTTNRTDAPGAACSWAVPRRHGRERAGVGLRVVGRAALDCGDRVSGRREVDLVHVLRTCAAVLGIPFEDELLGGNELGDVVGARPGQNGHSFGADRQVHGDGAERERGRPGGEVARVVRQPHDERVAVHGDAGRGLRLALQHGVGAHDVLHVLSPL
jgi:hypothetical protein